MPLTTPLAFTGCDQMAPGVDYLVQCSVASSIAIGTNTSAMTLVVLNAGERLFLRGPGYVKQLGATTLQPLQLPFAVDGLLSRGGGGGHEPPSLGE